MCSLSLGSQQGDSHLHWHIAPLPPGVPYDQQQLHALMAGIGVLAVDDSKQAAYLTRFTGSSREHARSDLLLAWCADRQLQPLAARRPHLELYIRWMQEIRRFKPSTVSRRFSGTAGLYRTAVIDAVLVRFS
jgi:hypothetical protein